MFGHLSGLRNFLVFLVANSLLRTIVHASDLRWNNTSFPPAVYGHVVLPMQLHSSLYPSESRDAGALSSTALILNGGWPWNPNLPDNIAYTLDPTTWTWFQLTLQGSPPSPRHYHSAVSTDDGTLCIIYGGFRTTVFGDVFVLYSPSQSTETPIWYSIQTTCESEADIQEGVCPPTARAGHTASLKQWDENTFWMIVSGGFDKNSQALSDIQILKIVKSPDLPNEWKWTWIAQDTLRSTIPNGPTARFFHAAHVYGDKLYAFGGTSDFVNPISEQRLFVLDLKTLEWLSLDAPSETSSNYASLISEPCFVEGIWGHKVNLVFTKDKSPVLVYFGGFIETWSNNLIIYYINDNRWELVTAYQALLDPLMESSVLIPEPRRLMSATKVMRGQEELLVYFGGFASSALQSLDILQSVNPTMPFLLSSTNSLNVSASQLYPQWVGLEVDQVLATLNMNAITGQTSSLFTIKGWGFSENPSWTNSVIIYPLVNDNDPLSSAQTDVSFDCLVSMSAASEIQCYSLYQPHGYYMVEVNVLDSNFRSIMSAQAVQYACLNSNYVESNVFEAATGILQFLGCFLKPSIDEISPTRGVGGVELVLFGSALGDSPNDSNTQIIVGGSACTSVRSTVTDGSSLSCTVGNHFGEDQVPIQLTTSRYFTKLENDKALLKTDISVFAVPKFDYLLKVTALTVVEKANTVEVTLSGRGFTKSGDKSTDGNVVGNTIRATAIENSSACQVVDRSEDSLSCLFASNLFPMRKYLPFMLELETWSQYPENVTTSQFFNGTYCSNGTYIVTGSFLAASDVSMQCVAPITTTTTTSTTSTTTTTTSTTSTTTTTSSTSTTTTSSSVLTSTTSSTTTTTSSTTSTTTTSTVMATTTKWTLMSTWTMATESSTLIIPTVFSLTTDIDDLPTSVLDVSAPSTTTEVEISTSQISLEIDSSTTTPSIPLPPDFGEAASEKSTTLPTWSLVIISISALFVLIFTTLTMMACIRKRRRLLSERYLLDKKLRHLEEGNESKSSYVTTSKWSLWSAKKSNPDVCDIKRKVSTKSQMEMINQEKAPDANDKALLEMKEPSLLAEDLFKPVHLDEQDSSNADVNVLSIPEAETEGPSRLDDMKIGRVYAVQAKEMKAVPELHSFHGSFHIHHDPAI